MSSGDQIEAAREAYAARYRGPEPRKPSALELYRNRKQDIRLRFNRVFTRHEGRRGHDPGWWPVKRKWESVLMDHQMAFHCVQDDWQLEAFDRALGRKA